ncbi:MAG: hypothetical protein E7541_01800 [Ruminococcaceae bacterium]|nr:hypothetical protein [Oscillospiraceae bacterium]
MLTIANRRECFFDDYLLDTQRTTATRQVHKPVRGPVLMVLDKPWEGNNVYFPCAIYAQGWWKLYYVCQHGSERYVGYAESADGLHWERPDLGLVDFRGDTHNNFILSMQQLKEFDFAGFDNMSVTYDDNPACPEDERYKMACMWYGHAALIMLMSSDGIHFTKSRVLTDDGAFDSANRVFWSQAHQQYFCYFRGEHDQAPGGDVMDRSFTDAVANALYDPERFLMREPGDGTASFMRDVRVMTSPDGIRWTPQQLIKTTGNDYQLYTNGVFPYPRAPHLLVAFPMRYVERKSWTPAYDELCGREDRLIRMNKMARFGLAISDGLFMCSRDGLQFTKYDEAILPPPPENPNGFVYGDGQAAPALIEVPAAIPGAESEYMLILRENFRSVVSPNQLVGYTIRKDGFVSLHAAGDPVEAVTKPFIYDGSRLYMNLQTSARGSVVVTLTGAEESVTSCAMFGNATDKRIRFEDDGAVARLAGKPVTLTLQMTDCDVYAIRFGE